MLSRIDHILGPKTNLKKFRKLEIISSIFFQSERYETRNQLQEENWEKYKHVKTKHVTKNPMVQ